MTNFMLFLCLFSFLFVSLRATNSKEKLDLFPAFKKLSLYNELIALIPDLGDVFTHTPIEFPEKFKVKDENDFIEWKKADLEIIQNQIKEYQGYLKPFSRNGIVFRVLVEKLAEREELFAKITSSFTLSTSNNDIMDTLQGNGQLNTLNREISLLFTFLCRDSTGQKTFSTSSISLSNTLWFKKHLLNSIYADLEGIWLESHQNSLKEENSIEISFNPKEILGKYSVLLSVKNKFPQEINNFINLIKRKIENSKSIVDLLNAINSEKSLLDSTKKELQALSLSFDRVFKLNQKLEEFQREFSKYSSQANTSYRNIHRSVFCLSSVREEIMKFLETQISKLDSNRHFDLFLPNISTFREARINQLRNNLIISDESVEECLEIDLFSDSIKSNSAKIKEIILKSEDNAKNQIKELILHKRKQNSSVSLEDIPINTDTLESLTDKIYRISIDLQLDSKLIEKAANILDFEGQIAKLKGSSKHEKFSKYLTMKRNQLLNEIDLLRLIYGCTADEKLKILEDEILETKRMKRVLANRKNYLEGKEPGIETTVDISQKEVDESSKIFQDSLKGLKSHLISHLIVDGLIFDEVNCLLRNESSKSNLGNLGELASALQKSSIKIQLPSMSVSIEKNDDEGKSREATKSIIQDEEVEMKRTDDKNVIADNQDIEKKSLDSQDFDESDESDDLGDKTVMKLYGSKGKTPRKFSPKANNSRIKSKKDKKREKKQKQKDQTRKRIRDQNAKIDPQASKGAVFPPKDQKSPKKIKMEAPKFISNQLNPVEINDQIELPKVASLKPHDSSESDSVFEDCPEMPEGFENPFPIEPEELTSTESCENSDEKDPIPFEPENYLQEESLNSDDYDNYDNYDALGEKIENQYLHKMRKNAKKSSFQTKTPKDSDVLQAKKDQKHMTQERICDQDSKKGFERHQSAIFPPKNQKPCENFEELQSKKSEIIQKKPKATISHQIKLPEIATLESRNDPNQKLLLNTEVVSVPSHQSSLLDQSERLSFKSCENSDEKDLILFEPKVQFGDKSLNSVESQKTDCHEMNFLDEKRKNDGKFPPKAKYSFKSKVMKRKNPINLKNFLQIYHEDSIARRNSQKSRIENPSEPLKVEEDLRSIQTQPQTIMPQIESPPAISLHSTDDSLESTPDFEDCPEIPEGFENPFPIEPEELSSTESCESEESSFKSCEDEVVPLSTAPEASTQSGFFGLGRIFNPQRIYDLGGIFNPQRIYDLGRTFNPQRIYDFGRILNPLRFFDQQRIPTQPAISAQPAIPNQVPQGIPLPQRIPTLSTIPLVPQRNLNQVSPQIPPQQRIPTYQGIPTQPAIPIVSPRIPTQPRNPLPIPTYPVISIPSKIPTQPANPPVTPQVNSSKTKSRKGILKNGPKLVAKQLGNKLPKTIKKIPNQAPKKTKSSSNRNLLGKGVKTLTFGSQSSSSGIKEPFDESTDSSSGIESSSDESTDSSSGIKEPSDESTDISDEIKEPSDQSSSPEIQTASGQNLSSEIQAPSATVHANTDSLSGNQTPSDKESVDKNSSSSSGIGTGSSQEYSSDECSSGECSSQSKKIKSRISSKNRIIGDENKNSSQAQPSIHAAVAKKPSNCCCCDSKTLIITLVSVFSLTAVGVALSLLFYFKIFRIPF